MTRADWVVITLASLLVAALYLHYWQPAHAATAVEVRSGSALVGRYPLNQNRVLDVHGLGGISHLEIRDGRVRFTASPCRNRICIQGGWLSQTGDTNACLPNGVSITLLGIGQRYDAISY